ncbi:transposase [Streptomyces sp. HC44]|uniref:Transposase n=1 Tax=Streptomyces scabichelini TaxID=2711217 RepID=A0A6G4V2Z7_9ACTN|nr:transposase [Streptomyces scabichelini]
MSHRRRPENHPRRRIVDAIRHAVHTGRKRRALPADCPPWRTCYGFTVRWAAAGIGGLIRDQFRKRIRRETGRAPERSPSSSTRSPSRPWQQSPFVGLLRVAAAASTPVPACRSASCSSPVGTARAVCGERCAGAGQVWRRRNAAELSRNLRSAC